MAVLALAVWLTMLPAPGLPSRTAMITDFRVGRSIEYVRLVLESDRPLTPPPTWIVDDKRLDMTLTTTGNQPTVPDLQEVMDDIRRIDVIHNAGTTRIQAELTFIPMTVKAFTLNGPDRFIIDCFRPLSRPLAGPLADTAAMIPEAAPPTAAAMEPSAEPSPPILALAMPPSSPSSAVSTQVSPPLSKSMASRDHHRLQQWLIVALIIVTTLICILLVILLWIRRGRRISRSTTPDWRHDLPPTRDQQIETLDVSIRNHLKRYDHMHNP